MMAARSLSGWGPARRLPPAWRAALDGVTCARPLPFLAAFAVAAGILVTLGDRAGAEGGGVIRLFLVVVTTGGLVRGMIAGDRRAARWILLFQRPFTPVQYYARVLGVTIVALLALFLLAGAAMLVTGLVVDGTMPGRPAWGALAGAALVAVQLLMVGAAISALVRRHDIELLLLFYFISLFQGVLARGAGGDVVPRILALALFPVDALHAVTEFLATGAPLPLVWWQVAHAIAYPVLALMAAWLAVRSFNHRDLPPDTA